MLLSDFMVRIKDRFERPRNNGQHQLDSIGIQFHDNFPSPTLTFLVIFILKLNGKYSNKR